MALCRDNGTMQHRHGSGQPPIRHHRVRWTLITLAALLCVAGVGWLAISWWSGAGGSSDDRASADASASVPATSALADLDRDAMPKPLDMSAQAQAERAVEHMTLDEQVGQLIMTPIQPGDDPATVGDSIAQQHIGAVLMTGNWSSGVSGVAQTVTALQTYAAANNQLITATDQEGGQVQHLKGTGFDAIPSAVQQGGMAGASLTQAAAGWGSQLYAAGINVDLAPSVDTVQVARRANAPIGALNRDFGLDGSGNADHAKAFIAGMRQAGVRTAIKHYPGLGAVTGNTDFTANGISDTTTTFDGEEMGAFATALAEDPGMVMMSLATYTQLDANAPAAFSSSIIDGHLRGTTGYQGVVVSDSLSATALGSIGPKDLGVRLVDAGGDIACIGDRAYVQPIIDGLKSRA